MRDMRLIAGVSPGASVHFRFDGEKLSGFEGEAISSALVRAVIGHLRVSRKRREPRAYYCGMGMCWECAVRVEGAGVVRGCIYPLREGLEVRTADGEQA